MHLSSASCSVISLNVSEGIFTIRAKCSVSLLLCLEHLIKIHKFTVLSWPPEIKKSRECFPILIQILSSQLLSIPLIIMIGKTIILPVVMHVCEMCSLREQQKLRVFGNKVFR
jgi:hypothetical protein